MAHPKIISGSPPELRRDIGRRVGQIAVFLSMTALLLFGAAGSLSWVYAWLYLVVSLAVILVNSLLVPLEVAAERGRKKANVERWDQVISGLLLWPWLGIYLIAGLDFRRQWSAEIGTQWHLLGLSLYVAGNFLAVWAMRNNRFFSTAVRIQFDRGHTVCRAGPYRYIRHPGYLGMIIYILASPLCLGSSWAVLPAVATAALFVVRTRLEDDTLQRKLAGYRDYAARTRYRLLPGVW